jgi:hypothetical protein
MYEIGLVLRGLLGRIDQVENEGGDLGRAEICREINPYIAPARKTEEGDPDRDRGVERSAEPFQRPPQWLVSRTISPPPTST